ncbi:MAG: hypothetical protein ACRDHZ_18265 [Ktedonobacteraceae bacterium]
MCVLCGEALTHIHWTEQRSDEQQISGDDRQRSRMRDRLHLVRLANRFLSHDGLHLDDWHGSKYLLSDRKGSSAIVQDLGSLWAAAEKLLHRPLDPLDPAFLTALATEKDEREKANRP